MSHLKPHDILDFLPVLVYEQCGQRDVGVLRDGLCGYDFHELGPAVPLGEVLQALIQDDALRHVLLRRQALES